jgi:magnesium transporter
LSAQPDTPVETSYRSKVRAFSYEGDKLLDEPIGNLNRLNELRSSTGTLWVDVHGVQDHELLKSMSKLFGLHILCMEDVINAPRPKFTQYADSIFLILQYFTSTPDLVSHQIAIAIGSNYVITFHEQDWPLFDSLLEHLKDGNSHLRKSRGDYLVYSIADSIVDSYFPILETLGEQLEQSEDEILDNPSRSAVANVHQVKRNLLTLRRALWPTREVLNALVRDGKPLLGDDSILHLRDCYDHAVQIIDFVETYRELGADLMDLYLSSISNRMNEVMKVLTIITTIFAPPTFIAGIYGMNFSHKVSPYNMPETYWYYGYPLVLALMLIVALSVVGLLWWKGWLGALTSNHPTKLQK